MKALGKLATYMIVALLAFSIYSCDDDDNEVKASVNELIGIWEGVNEDEWVVENAGRDEKYGKDISNIRYELKSDMTFNYLKKGNNTWNVDEYGKWEFKQNTVKLIYYYPNDGGYDEEDPDIWKILEFSPSSMVWEYHWKEPGFEIYSKQSLRKVN